LRLVRLAIDNGARALGWLRRKRRVRPIDEGGVIAVNLGCGLAVTKGWVNVDGSLNALIANMPGFTHRLAYRFSGSSAYYGEDEYLRLLAGHQFVHHDLKYGIPLLDASADYIYSSHFLEHLFRQDARNLLVDSFRVLRPGGTLRVVVPDLAYAVSLYADGRADEMLTQYFFVEDDNSYYARHKYMYDFEMLAALLREIGFKDVRRCAFQQGETPDLGLLDNRPTDSLFVEATR
jgi:SAM-dependent methyltransferase